MSVGRAKKARYVSEFPSTNISFAISLVTLRRQPGDERGEAIRQIAVGDELLRLRPQACGQVPTGWRSDGLPELVRGRPMRGAAHASRGKDTVGEDAKVFLDTQRRTFERCDQLGAHRHQHFVSMVGQKPPLLRVVSEWGQPLRRAGRA